MGQIPKPVLVTVTVLLTLCVLGGFALGFLPNLKHGGAADDEEAPATAALAASSAAIKDATPLAEPAPLPPKPKATAEAAASDATASDLPPV